MYISICISNGGCVTEDKDSLDRILSILIVLLLLAIAVSR
jgi:hypothetical protein